MDPVEGVIIVLVALVASTLAAVTGFGASLLLLPVLTWSFGVRDAVPMLAVVQICTNLARVGLNREDIVLPVARRFSMGSVPAAIIGGIVFAAAPASALGRLIGVFMILSVIFRHTAPGRRLKVSRESFLPLGAAFGFIDALVGSAGPIQAPFFLAAGLTGAAYIGTEALASVVMQGTKLAVYGGFSLVSWTAIVYGLAIGAVMFAGSYIGRGIVRRISPGRFSLIIEGMLLIAGVILIAGVT
ncbi:MAG: TSUP family transporter [Dehalococcoidia bacterium]|nr:TSUP family transporter [Dehalococcoidia bacterium]